MTIWRRDAIDSGWHIADGIGSVRSSASYGRPGGWWFLAEWLPDTKEYDIGPFRTKQLALQEAERLAKNREEISHDNARSRTTSCPRLAQAAS